MFDRFNRKSIATAGIAILATLGIGGAAVAQSSGSSTKAPQTAPAVNEAPGQESTAPENSVADTDNVQEGDQTGADQAEGPESANEKAEGPESANDDGPGGHADEAIGTDTGQAAQK